jgi:hypothetical protein
LPAECISSHSMIKTEVSLRENSLSNKHIQLLY